MGFNKELNMWILLSFSLSLFVFLLLSLFLYKHVCECVWWQRKRSDGQPHSSSSSSSQPHHLSTFLNPLGCMQERVALFGLVFGAVLCHIRLLCVVLCCCCLVPRYVVSSCVKKIRTLLLSVWWVKLRFPTLG